MISPLSTWRGRLFVPALLMLSAVLMVASIDIYIPSLPFLVTHYHTKEWVLQFSLMLSPLTAAFLGMVYGHISDRHGRKIVMLNAMLLFSIGSFLCPLATNIEMFLMFRGIQSIGSGGISVMSLAILADLFSGITYARYMATYSLMFPIMFTIAPLIGAYVFTYWGWEANFYLIGIWGSLLTLGLRIFLWETHLNRTLPTKGVFHKLIDLSRSTPFMTFSLGHSLPIAIYHLYVVNSPLIFITMLGLTPIAFSHVQLIPVGANLLGTLLYRQIISRLGLRRSLIVGIFAIGIFVSLVPMTVSWQTLPWFLVSITIFSFGLSFPTVSCATLAFEAVSSDKGVAIAYVGFMRNILMAGSVLGVSLFYNGSTPPLILSMIAFSVILMGILLTCLGAQRN